MYITGIYIYIENISRKFFWKPTDVVFVTFQVKPLLEVTKQEEKLTQKEDELRQIRDKLDNQMKRCQEYELKYQQANQEKTQLAEQLQVSFGFES